VKFEKLWASLRPRKLDRATFSSHATPSWSGFFPHLPSFDYRHISHRGALYSLL
jgi:hypothetical protein